MSEVATAKTIRKIPLEQIVILSNYRKPVRIEAMAFSLMSEGQLQPIFVRRWEGDKYAIVTGARRYQGMLYANSNLGGKFQTIDSIVIESKLTKQEEDLLQLVLNESLDSPVEKAVKIVELVEEGMTQERVAQAFGYKQAYISMLKKKIVPNKIFRQYIKGETILMIEDKEENKKYFGSEFSDFQSLLNEKPSLVKTFKELKPGTDETVKLISLDYIKDVYYKLETLNRIDIFNEMIIHLQQKKIYETDKIKSLCERTIKSIEEKLEKKEENEKVNQDPVEASFKISKTLMKFKWNNDLINQLNNILAERKIPIIITKK